MTKFVNVASIVLLIVLVACVSAIPPILYPKYEGEVIKHVLPQEELNEEWEKRVLACRKLRQVLNLPIEPCGVVKSINGFWVKRKDGICEYWIAESRVDTSTENHEEHHCTIGGNFHSDKDTRLWTSNFKSTSPFLLPYSLELGSLVQPLE